MKILIVDDDTLDREVLKDSLILAGHEIRIARDGAEAWEMLCDDPCRMVITDWVMPGMDGVILCRRIREAKLPHYVYVILLTARATDLDVEEGLAAGADDILRKPFKPGELRLRIHNAERVLNLEEVAVVNRELTEARSVLQKQNTRLQELYGTAQTFVDNVSHEFRTPLTVIKEYASLISEGAFGDVTPDQRQFLQVIENRADDLNTMVDDMLDGSRLDSGMVSVVRRNCRINDIFERVRPILERKAASKDVDLRFEMAEPLLEVYVDEEKIGRVLINLVVNAVKFCSDPGKVRVWAKPHASGEVIVGVTDNGPGIPTEQQGELFQRFKQLETNIRGSSKGFGLGLNIAKELVDLNLGKMGLDSKPKSGATFTFTLPLAEPMAVLERYLDRIEAFRNGETLVSLVTATIPAADASSSAEVEEFLAHLMRGNDLLFQADTHCWLLLTPLSDLDLEKMLERFHSSFRDANRNRPREALPEIVYERLGTWSVTDTREQIKQQVAQTLNLPERNSLHNRCS